MLSSDMSRRGATYTETSFKKMVSQHRVSREKAVAQVCCRSTSVPLVEVIMAQIQIMRNIEHKLRCKH